MGNPLTTAYAGHADITEANVKALLDQFLPQDPPEGDGLGLVFIPERVIRAQKGLKTTIAWLETELGGPESTIPVEDLIAEMLKRKDAEGDDLMLFLLFDPEHEDDVALANAANDAGIQIRNLAAAGDFLEFEEEPPADEQPPWEAEAPAADAVAEVTVAALPAAIQSAAALDMNLTLDGLVKILARAIVAEMANLGAAQVEAQQAPVKPVAAAPAEDTGNGRPADGELVTEPFPGSVAIYYHAEKSTWRKARGIPREGEVKIYMTEADAKDAIAVTTARPPK